MLSPGKYIRKIEITYSTVDKDTIRNLRNVEYGAFIIKILTGLVFLGVGIFLISKGFQYPDAELNLEVSGIKIETKYVIPGVLCIIFGFILVLFSRINITIKKE